MPHYHNGELAKIGDHVGGKGYNVKGPITGIVVGVVEGEESCNLRVAYLRPAAVNTTPANDASKPTGHSIEYGRTAVCVESVPLVLEIEYGDTKRFHKLNDAGQICSQAHPDEERAAFGKEKQAISASESVLGLKS